MVEKPRYLRLRIGLRTLFVLITIYCCWLGWESSIVRRRQATLRELAGNNAFQFVTAEQWALGHPAGSPSETPARIPLVRRWLGDQAIQEILYTPHFQGYSEAELKRIAEVFPEARQQELFAEPCHPGCFPRGTWVATPTGRRRIESLQVGDAITTFSLAGMCCDGSTSQGTVRSIFVTTNRLWEVTTDQGVLVTTEAQPLCTSSERIVQAGELRPGDSLLYQRGPGTVESVGIQSVAPTERIVTVYNLVLGDRAGRESPIFLANGFLARSKPPAVAAANQGNAE